MIRVPLTPERRAELDGVNWRINADVMPLTDAAQYHTAEFWTEAEAAGDCEDYALRKRRDLRELGWPKESLDIALCWVWSGEYHAVLIAHTDAGDFVLDNLSGTVWRWDEITNYRWDRVSVGGSLKQWVSAKPGVSLT